MSTHTFSLHGESTENQTRNLDTKLSPDFQKLADLADAAYSQAAHDTRQAIACARLTTLVALRSAQKQFLSKIN